MYSSLSSPTPRWLGLEVQPNLTCTDHTNGTLTDPKRVFFKPPVEGPGYHQQMHDDPSEVKLEVSRKSPVFVGWRKSRIRSKDLLPKYAPPFELPKITSTQSCTPLSSHFALTASDWELRVGPNLFFLISMKSGCTKKMCFPWQKCNKGQSPASPSANSPFFSTF